MDVSGWGQIPVMQGDTVVGIVTRTDLLGLTSSHNGRSGISVGGASRVRIDTCTAAGNGVAQVRTEGYSITALVDNQLDPASAPALVQDGGRIVQE